MTNLSDSSENASHSSTNAAAAYLVYVLYILGYFTGLVSLAALALNDGLHYFVASQVFECETLVATCSASVYGLPFFAGFTSVAALILAYVKRASTRGHWIESHFTWQIMLFWYWLAIGVVGMALFLVYVMLGYVLILGTIWGVWRVVKGWSLLATHAPIDNPRRFL